MDDKLILYFIIGAVLLILIWPYLTSEPFCWLGSGGAIHSYRDTPNLGVGESIQRPTRQQVEDWRQGFRGTPGYDEVLNLYKPAPDPAPQF